MQFITDCETLRLQYISMLRNREPVQWVFNEVQLMAQMEVLSRITLSIGVTLH
jgi:hypothetical protein